MFSVKKYDNIQLTISLLPVLLVIGPHRSQIMTKIPMIFVIRADLGIILPFTVDYSYLQFDL